MDVFALLEGEFGGIKEAEEVKKHQKVRACINRESTPGRAAEEPGLSLESYSMIVKSQYGPAIARGRTQLCNFLTPP